MRRFFLFTGVIALLALVSGCDRGSHPAQIGALAPDFTVRDAQRSVTLSKLRGKPVLLNFWASWCGPCIEETPSLVALQRRLGDKVTILGVSIDENEGAYLRFLRDQHIEYLTVRDPKKDSPNLYGTFAWPETYIIDANGIIRRKLVGPTNWASPDMVQFLNSVQSNNTAAAAK